jgi:hypothetical protein
MSAAGIHFSADDPTSPFVFPADAVCSPSDDGGSVTELVSDYFAV